MRNPFPRSLTALVACLGFLAVPASPGAFQGDCGQPVSTGSSPKTSDVQAILKEAVGQATACHTRPCVCDVNGDDKISVADALLALRCSVGFCQPVEPGSHRLACRCEESSIACTEVSVSARWSDLDLGWTGIGHGPGAPGAGPSVDLAVVRRCSDSQAVCETDFDCANHDCAATCDCNVDTSCELAGPTHGKRCATTATECATNADCPLGVSCEHFLGAPLPLSSGGTPMCVMALFDGPVTGTLDSSTGAATFSSNLKARVLLGLSLDQPCPRCGAASPDLQVGQVAKCEGGQFPGALCRVDGVSELFGGTSFDCPPALASSISGAGLAVRFGEVTTGVATRTAQLPCGQFAFQSNPLNAPATPGRCIDTQEACGSNADCRRCTGDPSTACTSDDQCSGKGACAEAPDQPISCGFWCHCGFCDGNAGLPCFADSDCPGGEECLVGPGSGTAANSPQRKPNDCSSDGFVCGEDATEQCATTLGGTCELQPYRSCVNDESCPASIAGSCLLGKRSCFESRIVRTGEPSPAGSYCAYESRSCASNADCLGPGDFCAPESARPEVVALFCSPGTANASLNASYGITGPGAVRLGTFVQVCRCGDGRIGCGEQCDDANVSSGDGCNERCRDE